LRRIQKEKRKKNKISTSRSLKSMKDRTSKQPSRSKMREAANILILRLRMTLTPRLCKRRKRILRRSSLNHGHVR
jgi:hypothetical protein